MDGRDSRSGDDDFGVDELLVEFGVFTFFVGGRYEGVALVFEPFSESELIFGRSWVKSALKLSRK